MSMPKTENTPSTTGSDPATAADHVETAVLQAAFAEATRARQERAEQDLREAEERRRAQSPTYEAARLIGAKPDEIAGVKVDSEGRLFIRTTDGTTVVHCPPTAPDAEGKWGTLAVCDDPRRRQFLALPAFVGQHEIDAAAMAEEAAKEERERVVAARAQLAEEEVRFDDDACRRLIVLIDEHERALAAENRNDKETLKEELKYLRQMLKRRRNMLRAKHLEENPPGPRPFEIRIHQAAVVWGRAHLAGLPAALKQAELNRAAAIWSGTITWSPANAAHELATSKAWLREHGFDLPEGGPVPGEEDLIA